MEMQIIHTQVHVEFVKTWNEQQQPLSLSFTLSYWGWTDTQSDLLSLCVLYWNLFDSKAKCTLEQQFPTFPAPEMGLMLDIVLTDQPLRCGRLTWYSQNKIQVNKCEPILLATI